MQLDGTAPKRGGGRPRGPRVTIMCVVCGTPKDVKPSEASRGAKFCDDVCAVAYRQPTVESTHDRVWAKIQKTDTSWLWTGAKNSMGYGHFLLTKNPPVYKLVSHYMWWEKTGHWPVKGEAILHTCDTTCGTVLCVRNDDEGTYKVRGRVLPRWGHLALGTVASNNADMTDKGRQAHGERHGRVKLTAEQVTEIRRMTTSGMFTHRELGAMFKVHHTTIAKIVRGERWK